MLKTLLLYKNQDLLLQSWEIIALWGEKNYWPQQKSSMSYIIHPAGCLNKRIEHRDFKNFLSRIRFRQIHWIVRAFSATFVGRTQWLAFFKIYFTASNAFILSWKISHVKHIWSTYSYISRIFNDANFFIRIYFLVLFGKLFNFILYM